MPDLLGQQAIMIDQIEHFRTAGEGVLGFSNFGESHSLLLDHLEELRLSGTTSTESMLLRIESAGRGEKPDQVLRNTR